MRANDLASRTGSPGGVPRLLRIGITGGIGSGKTTVCRRLEAAGHRVFYTDSEAKRIIRTHPAVRRELRALVGEEVYDAEGQLVKSVLAAYLTQGLDHSQKVDAVVHPRVAEAFLQFCADREAAVSSCLLPRSSHVSVEVLAALPPAAVVFMECALLFEARFDRYVDCSVLVHVSAATQLRRLMARDGISREKAQAWISLQLGEEEKLRRADFIIDNETEQSEAEMSGKQE